jgi:P2-related tail formation protein
VSSALLPPNAGPFERALTEAATDTLPVPIEQVLDPAETPAEFLSFLAQHEGVRLWYSDWPEERKRQIIADWSRLASLIGTRGAAEAFLAYVDTVIVHKLSHPANMPLDMMALGIDPYAHPSFHARFLAKTDLTAHDAAFIIGWSALDVDALVPIDVTPLNRAMDALVVSKAPETQYAISFAHRIPVSIDDGLDLDAGHDLETYRDRIRL